LGNPWALVMRGKGLINIWEILALWVLYMGDPCLYLEFQSKLLTSEKDLGVLTSSFAPLFAFADTSNANVDLLSISSLKVEDVRSFCAC
jgi:hypothetical protein